MKEGNEKNRRALFWGIFTITLGLMVKVFEILGIDNTILVYIVIVFFGMAAMQEGYKTLKEINRIKVNDNDEIVEAKVVSYEYVFNSSDIKPILLYEMNGEKKLYKFYTYHRRREYPIGKNCMLNLSRTSGVAYDKGDLKRGKIYQYFWILFGASGLALMFADILISL